MMARKSRRKALISSLASPILLGLTVNVSAPGTGVPTGSITITGTPGVEVCVITLPAASCDLIVQTALARTFDISYAGDSRFLASNTQVSAQVLPDTLFDSGFEEDE